MTGLLPDEISCHLFGLDRSIYRRMQKLQVLDCIAWTCDVIDIESIRNNHSGRDHPDTSMYLCKAIFWIKSFRGTWTNW
jgi:hypothetical protein